MSKKTIFVVTILICSFAMPAMAGNFDGSKPLICAITRSYECGEEGCAPTTAAQENLPNFFVIDFNARLIESAPGSVVVRKTAIRQMERSNGRLIIQGIELRPWSLTIGEQTGAMTIVASDEDGGFVIMGNCSPR